MHQASPVRWCAAWRMRYSVGSRMLMFGDAMSIFARSTCAPSGNSPARIRRNRSRFSSTRPIAVRAVPARLGQRAAVLRESRRRVRLSTYALPSRIELLGVRDRAARSSPTRRTSPVPLETEPAHVVLDRLDVLDVFLGRVRVVEAEVAQRRRTRCATPKFEADRLRVADVQVAVRLGRKARVHAAAVPAGFAGPRRRFRG